MNRLILFKELYYKTLIDLFEKEDSEVSPKYDNSYKSIFLKPKLINTSLSLDYQTRFQFKKKDWTALFVVAETGEWILKKTEEFVDKKVILVIADNVKESKLVSKIGLENLTIHKLKWWLHNQHMTIFLKGDESNYEPIRAIYFVRRHRGTHLHPVFLEAEDCKLLIEAFAAYCKKSTNIKEYENDDLPTEVSKDDIAEFKNDFMPSSK